MFQLNFPEKNPRYFQDFSVLGKPGSEGGRLSTARTVN